MAIAKLLRYPDLKAAGVVNNRVTLGRLIKTQDFPPGRLLGQNSRAWTEPEIEAWLASRPTVRTPDATPREQRLTAKTGATKAATPKRKAEPKKSQGARR